MGQRLKKTGSVKEDQVNEEYVKLLLLHFGIGFAIYLFEPAAKLILHASLVYFLFIIVQNQNRNNEALMAAAYIAGAEVFYRMTGGSIFYETGKYMVIVFLFIGLIFKGSSVKTVPFWIYLLI